MSVTKVTAKSTQWNKKSLKWIVLYLGKNSCRKIEWGSLNKHLHSHVIYGWFLFLSWSNWQVISRSYSEAKVVCHIWHVLRVTSSVDIRVRTHHVSISVPLLCFGRVGIRVAINHISKFVLGMILGSYYSARSGHDGRGGRGDWGRCRL